MVAHPIHVSVVSELRCARVWTPNVTEKVPRQIPVCKLTNDAGEVLKCESAISILSRSGFKGGSEVAMRSRDHCIDQFWFSSLF